jgi:hypothetical protein
MFRFSKQICKAIVLASIVSGLVVGCQSGLVTENMFQESTASTGTQEKNNSSLNHDEASYLAAKKYVEEQLELLRKQAKPLSPETIRSIDSYQEAVSRATAVLLAENKDARESLYNACMEKFDGETNVLWKTLDSRQDFSRKIAASAQRAKRSQAVAQLLGSDADVKSVIGALNRKASGQMHLFWAFPQNWDKKTAPLVVYISAGRQKSDFGKPYTGFDAEGNQYNVTEEIAKQRPVVVFAINERTKADGRLVANLITPQNQLAQNVPHKMGTSTANSNRTININTMYLDPNGNYDEWGNGTYEIFYDVEHEVVGGNGPYYTARSQAHRPNYVGQTNFTYPLGVTLTLHGSNNHYSEYSSAINGYLGVIFRWWEDDTFFSPDGLENDYVFDDPLGWHGTFTLPQYNQPYGGTVSINVSVY